MLAACVLRAQEQPDIAALFEQQRWQETIDAAARLPPDPLLDYYAGAALSRLGRYQEARLPLFRAAKVLATDARIPLELGAIAFREKRYGEAAYWLRHALHLSPRDAYTLNFLGTIYFLQGNLDATLLYWNRIDKPRIEHFDMPPGLRVDPVLLDNASAIAPASTLRLDNLYTTRARIAALGIFPDARIELDAQAGGNYIASLIARERNGFGNTKWEAALSLLRGLPYQAIYPEYYNLHGSATNITSLLRWDTQKRRALVTLSGQLNPVRRYQIIADVRDENWQFRPSTQLPRASLGTFGLTRAALGASITSTYGSWDWSAGAEFSHRSFPAASPPIAGDVLTTGYQLKQTAQLNRAVLRFPARRFESTFHASSELGKFLTGDSHLFERLQTGISAVWFPQMKGDDYAIQTQARAGKLFGAAPLDELYQLGLERDNGLWLRGHIGTADGRKGSAPLGRNYFLSNWEIDKVVYNDGLINFKLSPFLDSGKITGLSRTSWMVDTGLQAKVRVLGIGFTVLYGKDLRTGRNSFYILASSR